MGRESGGVALNCGPVQLKAEECVRQWMGRAEKAEPLINRRS